jgi:hypothetical protein
LRPQHFRGPDGEKKEDKDLAAYRKYFGVVPSALHDPLSPSISYIIKKCEDNAKVKEPFAAPQASP